MGIEIRTPTEEDWPAMCHVDGRAFGFTYPEDRIKEARGPFDLSRFRIACDGGEVVGIVGAFAFDVTVPGGATVPMAGVTWVGAAATHRRQGIVSRLMEAVHRDTDLRGEPLANLTASESGIYERFGYGIANHIRAAQIVKARAQFRDEFTPKPGAVRFLGDAAAREEIPQLWDRYRRTRAGEVSRSPEMHELFFAIRGRPEDGASATWHVRHADGYASYRVVDEWSSGWASHELRLTDFVALTPEAHAALWHTLLSIDLVSVIKVYRLPEDDPLGYLLKDYRAVQTTALNDGLWNKVLDPKVAFGARTYETADRLVVEVSDGERPGRYAIEGDVEGGSVKSVRTRPDLTMSAATLGALLYGGIRPSLLAAGRRIEARNDAALRRADVFFPTARAPFCQTPY